MGEHKKLSELKVDSYFVFAKRKYMPCIYNGTSWLNNKPIFLWSELKEHNCWTFMGEDYPVIDYGDNLPYELNEKRRNYLNKI